MAIIVTTVGGLTLTMVLGGGSAQETVSTIDPKVVRPAPNPLCQK